MKIRDVMCKDVISVAPHTPVREIAAIMAEKRISGLPVITADGQVIGMVSQSDLLHRAELGTERRRKWWLRILADDRQLAHEFKQAHGQTARDVMTRHMVTVRADAELADAADLLDKHGIKRLPVMHDGKLVGMVTRTDLVRALVDAKSAKNDERLDDAEIHKALVDRMRREPWIGSTLVSASVENGTITLSGFVESPEQRDALKILAEEVAGIGSVVDRISIGLPLMSGV